MRYYHCIYYSHIPAIPIPSVPLIILHRVCLPAQRYALRAARREGTGFGGRHRHARAVAPPFYPCHPPTTPATTAPTTPPHLALPLHHCPTAFGHYRRGNDCSTWPCLATVYGLFKRHLASHLRAGMLPGSWFCRAIRRTWTPRPCLRLVEHCHTNNLLYSFVV